MTFVLGTSNKVINIQHFLSQDNLFPMAAKLISLQSMKFVSILYTHPSINIQFTLVKK